MRTIRPVMPWLAFLLCFGTVLPSLSAEKQTIGWAEQVTIADQEVTLSAKMDTGATHSSLNTPELHLFKKNDESWVKFAVARQDGQILQFEARVVRMVKIKQKGERAQVRPVIHMVLCLGNVLKKVEVNLADRSKFDFPILVGRSFLQDEFIIDVSKKFTTTPHCGTFPETDAMIVPK
ncbi:MAG: ATP-dependent zinc protease [Gammaproteobacteria bacterium]|nr:ATP-dependent zinc protease [Gammaproteobacteria bacterium]